MLSGALAAEVRLFGAGARHLLLLESVQKLSEEPRKEYAGGIWLFSFGACIRVI
jgi:hypothetical protein